MSDLISVIDDDTDLRESIAEILSENGFRVNSFESAEAALKDFQTRAPSLVIVDNMMPGMGGLALIPVLKKDFPQIKIVMITAFSTVENAVSAMRVGADDYMAKPFKRDELLAVVRRNLEELKFAQNLVVPGMDDVLSCLSNQIRRQILSLLASKKKMRFMDITRELNISDHTKVNFHLKNLKSNSLITVDTRKNYSLTEQGEKMVDCLSELSKKIPH